MQLEKFLQVGVFFGLKKPVGVFFGFTKNPLDLSSTISMHFIDEMKRTSKDKLEERLRTLDSSQALQYTKRCQMRANLQT